MLQEALAQATRVTSDTAGEPLVLTFVLRHDDQAGFDRHLRELGDPRSPNHRRYLTPREIADRFGPSEAAYDRLARHLRARGLAIVDQTDNRLTLTVRGARADVERALDVEIGDYQLHGRTFHATDRDPALPADLALHVRNVTGLSNLARPQPALAGMLLQVNLTLCVLMLAPIGPPAGYKICGPNPDEQYFKQCLTEARLAAGAHKVLDFDYFAKKTLNYFDIVLIGQPCPGDPPMPTSAFPSAAPSGLPAPPVVASGAGQKIAVIGFDSFLESDVADYLTLTGFDDTQMAKLSRVRVNGGAPLGPDQDEMLLDVTTVMTVAPGADVVAYDAPFTGQGSFQALFNAALDDGATIITNSWAYCESQTTRADVEGIDAIFADAAMAGVSIFNASGDSGSTCLDGSPNTAAVPASAPNATAVGGASFTSGEGQDTLGQRWWNGVAGTPPTGQGGFSTSRFFARPAYQNGHTTAAMRSVPDLVTSADPTTGVMICQASAGGCPSGLRYGGTSLSAPLMAGLTAIMNESLGRNLGFLNPELYPLAGTDAFVGPAALGSDFAHVGLGSPQVDHLLIQLGDRTVGMPDPNASWVSPGRETDTILAYEGPYAIAADGVSEALLRVRLVDENRNPVAGKTVTLAADPPGNVDLTPASGVTDEHGAVVFTATNLVPEAVTFTATDTTDGIELTNRPVVPFVSPPAAAGGIVAAPTNVTANGVATTTITVTLRDALDRPSPGKLITLDQGDGHSIVTAPDPSVTDVAGQIQFTATNLVNETVTYRATDVTDGDLPVPGSAVVTFGGGSPSACGSAEPPAGLNGWTVTPYANGFFAEPFNFGNVNWGGCPGTSLPAFVDDETVALNFRTGGVYRFPAAGGAVTSAHLLDTIGETLGNPTFTPDGRLYATRGATTGDYTTGVILELDAETGAVLRTVAENLVCPSTLIADPLSGDLFFNSQCFGGGSQHPFIYRVRNRTAVTPTVELYATLPSSPSGFMAFAPNGTLYAVSNYLLANPDVMRVSGTDTASPGTVTPVVGVTSNYSLAIGEVGLDGEARSLVVHQDGDLTVVDLTTTPPAEAKIATGAFVAGVNGSDGCLYIQNGPTIFRLRDPSGGCSFATTTPKPAITLTPASADATQGAPHTLTATLQHVDAPEGTPIFFQVTGANTRVQMVRADAAGQATLAYTGLFAGEDAIVATATVGDEKLVSNRARATWTAGKHVTFLTLNTSPRGGTVGSPSSLVASLVDASVEPPAPVAGASIRFSLGGAECTATTDAAGRATCALAPPAAGTHELLAVFAGSSTLAEARATLGFQAVEAAGVDQDMLGSFTVYAARPAKGAPKPLPFGPLTLTDPFGSFAYDVKPPKELGVAAMLNELPSGDLATHLVSWAVKGARKSPRVGRRSVAVADACSTTTATLKKPVRLLAPASLSLDAPVTAPGGGVDHLLCYQAKAGGLAKGTQVDVVDQLQTRRYELRKLAWVCLPTATGGEPLWKKGAQKGEPYPFTPAVVAHPEARLSCYTAKRAKRRVEQTGCGPTDPKDGGTRIQPPQPKHQKRRGIHVADAFAAGQLDTKKELLVCLPPVPAS